MNKDSLKETNVLHQDGDIQIKMYEKYGNAPYHWHDEYEFICAKKGICICRIDSKEFQLKAGECILIRGGQLHSLNCDFSKNCSYFAIVFHPYIVYGSDCQKYFSGKYTFKQFYSVNTKMEACIIESLSHIYNTIKQKPFAYELKLKLLLLTIFSKIFEFGFFEIATQHNTKNIKNNELTVILQYIHDNYKNKITINELAQLINYSASYVTRFFKYHIGKTPIEYINHYRIYRAKQLLENINMTVLDVSFDVGFDNVGYFIRTFKKQEGITPFQFRKKCSD